MKSVGYVLIALGIIFMLITGYNVVQREKVLDLGKVEVTKETTHPVRWSPIVGVILLVGGVVILLTDNKRTAAH